MTDGLTEQITQLLREAHDERASEHSIKPAILADDAMRKMMAGHSAPILVRHAATLECRQLARALLRVYDPPTEAPDPHARDLFEALLPARIPDLTSETDEPAYIVRLEASLKQRRAYSAVMRRHIESRTQRLNAFDLETERLIETGDLVNID